MAKHKKKQEQRYKKVGLVALLKGTLKDLYGVLASLTPNRGRGRSLKGMFQDLGRGCAYLLARPVRLSLGLIAIVGLVILFSLFLFNKETRIKAYLDKAETCLASEDYQNAIIHYEKAIGLGPVENSSTYLNYIRALIENGDTKKSREVISRLAPGPGNRPGIEEVHRMIALELSRKQANSQAVNVENFKWHLDHSGNVDSAELNFAWAQYNLSVGNLQKAVSFCKAAAAADPMYFELVLELHGRLGQRQQQESAAKDARPKVENLVKRNPRDDVARVLLSKVLFILGDEDESERLLQEGIELTDSRSLRNAYGNFLVTTYRRHAKSNSFTKNLELLRNALLYSTNNDGPSFALYELTQSTNTPAEKAAVIDVLQEATGEPAVAAKAHNLLASILWDQNRKAESREHAEKFYELEPSSPVAANNLAFQLGESEQPELKRALRLARFAVEKLPDNPDFRDTLGTILMKMNQYRDATAEFEKAITRNIADAASVHGQLAICYDKLGNPAMSQLHADLSKRNGKQ